MTKRSFDVAAAFCGLLLLGPLLALIALAIKLDSRGPVFFRQERVGRRFRLFRIVKFRTMVADAEEQGGQLTVEADSRVTRVGSILRRTKLDELPQLWNVLRGEMSLVGPRPEVRRYVERFHDDYEEVLSVAPGITDLASLKYRDEASLLASGADAEDVYCRQILPDKIQLAKEYVRRASLLLDVSLILATIRALASGGDRPAARAPRNLATPVARRALELIRTAPPTVAAIRHRRIVVVALHAVLAMAANALAFWLRFDGDIPPAEANIWRETILWLVAARLLTFVVFRLNEGLWRYTSIWDLKNIIAGVFTSTALFFAFTRLVLQQPDYPRSIFLIDSLLLVCFMGGLRLSRRFYQELTHLASGKRVLVFGAGDAGEMIVRDMKRYRGHTPIGFIDDNEAKVGRRIHGVRVLGTRRDLPRIMAVEKPDEVLVAIPRAQPATTRALVKLLQPYSVPITTLPNIRHLIDGRVTVSQIRKLSIEDLLSRTPVGLGVERVHALLRGRRVLVTGAGGSIGSELCRQIIQAAPEALVLFERYENSLYAIVNELADRRPGGLTPVIGDVTDAKRLNAVFAEHRPHVVFHAAAHKHVPLMEINASEAVKNNVIGTRRAAQAAERWGVERFILISSDKAVNPASVMGATKRVAELILQGMAERSATCFVTVRFGNVLGSNGSVVPRFLEQIQAGGPVTVTHPEIRRYFMLIPEAVQLVLQSAAVGESGGLFVLDMGEQIKVVDLARNLIRLSGYIPDEEIPISFIGLRPGEKLAEELVNAGEVVESSGVDTILRLSSAVRPDREFVLRHLPPLESFASLGDDAAVVRQLCRLVPSFRPADSAAAADEGAARQSGPHAAA
jgi:FlaA1/EpsC-like NDP-sugar epimerase/lipopolysaccharide/colanic/teichoic acid biosynthesis glycosyltransferase